MDTYLHVLEGRIRIKVPQVKGDAQNASRLEHILQSTKGVIDVKANPLTGNVLILFETGMITHEEILDIISNSGAFPNGSKKISRGTSQSEQAIVNFLFAHLADRLLQIALERLIVAII